MGRWEDPLCLPWPWHRLVEAREPGLVAGVGSTQHSPSSQASGLAGLVPSTQLGSTGVYYQLQCSGPFSGECVSCDRSHDDKDGAWPICILWDAPAAARACRRGRDLQSLFHSPSQRCGR